MRRRMWVGAVLGLLFATAFALAPLTVSASTPAEPVVDCPVTE